MTPEQLTGEMDRLDDALVNILGVKPQYMRPPYLMPGGNVLPTLKTLDFKVITTDVDSGDWDSKTPEESLLRFTRAGSCGKGHISVMHETYASTVRTLTPYLIDWAKSRNLKLVTVGEFSLLDLPSRKSVPLTKSKLIASAMLTVPIGLETSPAAAGRHASCGGPVSSSRAVRQADEAEHKQSRCLSLRAPKRGCSWKSSIFLSCLYSRCMVVATAATVSFNDNRCILRKLLPNTAPEYWSRGV